MDETRIERALRQGPPEPNYRPINLRETLMQADRQSTSRSGPRLATAFAAAVGALAVGLVLMVLIFRPGFTPQVGGPTTSPSASPPPSAVIVAPSASATAPSAVPSGPPPSSTAVPTPSQQPSASAVADCHLKWTIGRVEGAAGSRFINVDVVNDSSVACSGSSVVVGVTLRSPNGSVIATAASENGPIFQVQPGQTASGFSQWTNWCGPMPPGPLTLSILAEGAGEPLPFTTDTPPCTSPGKPSNVTPLTMTVAP